MNARVDIRPDDAILIVEDESIIALDMKLQLEDLGYRVVGTAEGGEQALQLVRQHEPSLVLMDIRLKGPMDGIETAAIVAREYGIPVVFLTSHADADTVQRAAQTAAYGYLTKPFQIKELRAGIEVALTKATMERQLREADRWFASTLRCVHDGVVVTGADARIRFLNPAAEALLGLSVEEAIGRDVAEVARFAPPAQAAQPILASNAVLRALQEGRVIGVEHGRRLQSRGREVPVDESAGPVDDEFGHRMGAVLILRDATERLKQEAQLRASEERFRNAFDFAPQGMALVSLDGRFIRVNDPLCRMLGRDAAWLREQFNASVTAAEDVAQETQRLHELRAGGVPVTQFEKRYLHRAGGDAIWTLVSVSLLGEADAPTCFLYQIYDLTEQRKAAEQLSELAAEMMRAEADEMANRAKSEFLSRASHEMRTPLNAVLGFAQLLRTQTSLDRAKTQAYADHILKAGEHLLAMVNDVLDLQQASKGRLQLQMTSVALDASVSDAARLLMPMAREHQIDFALDVPAGLRARADETRLRQVLLNLGSNAVKYNRPSGKVTWSAQPACAGRVRLIIADTGIGMTAEQMQHLFQPFERLGQENSKIPGTGLGLEITRHLVEQMGGAMTLTSTPREGTRVELEFDAG